MKRKLTKILAVAFTAIVCLFAVTGCGEKAYVTGIERTGTGDTYDVYTVTYSDGSTATLDISRGANGKDGANGANGASGLNGKDGADVTVDDLFNKYLELYPTATYEQFLAEYLTLPSDNSAVINKSLRSSARVYTEFTASTQTWPYAPITTNTVTAQGSAVVYATDATYTYFLTNYHVVYNANAKESNKLAKRIVLYLYGSEGSPSADGVDDYGYQKYDYGTYAIDCSYVGGSITADLAIVKAPTSTVSAVNSGVVPVTMASGYNVGETAIAIGNPEGEGISVTEGIVSVDNEYISYAIDEKSRYYRSIRIDTAIYSGSSGGGLFNSKGELIGITNAGDQTDQNINYAIPVDIVKAAAENIMHYASQGGTSAKKIALGVTVSASNSKYVYNASLGYGEIVETITVSEITADGIMDVTGVSVGDVITAMKINDTVYNINRNFEIGDLLLTVRSGDTISFNYTRSGSGATSTAYTVQEPDLTEIA